MTTYIAGPMTGLPDFNFPAFHAVAAALRARGMDVRNPADNGGDTSKSWDHYMRLGLRLLLGVRRGHAPTGLGGQPGRPVRAARRRAAWHESHRMEGHAGMSMPVQVVGITPKDAKAPRAVRIPDEPTASDIDDVLYGFGFEYFGDRWGVQRLLALDDDSITDYGDAADVMRDAGVNLALYDRDEHAWVPLHPGDWVVDPQDGDGDGFVRMTDAVFTATYDVLPQPNNQQSKEQ